MKHGDFTELAGLYHNRPAYNPLMIEKLIACINDSGKPLNKLDIAEVGAGTGKLTAILARDFGLKITAVEPNDAMREEGIKATQGLDIKWLKGSGEQTNLQSNSADWLIMASSFHWTDPTKSLPEFARVLRGGNSQMSPSLAEGDFCFAIARNCKQTGGGYENATNSQNPLNSCHIERSEISQENRDSSPCSCKAQNDNIKENSNAEFTHPHTPSASEGAFKGEPSAQQGAFRGESSTQPKESCVNSQSAQQEALTSKPRNERERERDGFAKTCFKFTKTLSKPRDKLTKLISYNYLQPTRYKARLGVL